MFRFPKTVTLSIVGGIIFGSLICILYVYKNQSDREAYHHVASSFIQSDNIIKNKDTNINKVYQSLCNQEKNICNKLVYKGEYTEAEKQEYGIITLYFINTLDSLIGREKLVKAIDYIYISFIKDTRRGYSTHNTVFLHTPGLSYQEYMMVLIHELGHIIDLGILQGQSKKENEYFTEFGEKAFAIDDISLQYYALSRDSEHQRKNIETRQSFCSIYAMSSPFEDFAECFQLYMNHQKYFRSLIKDNSTLAKKYYFLKKLTNGKYFYNKLQNIYYKNDTQYRYRDTTRMR